MSLIIALLAIIAVSFEHKLNKQFYKYLVAVLIAVTAGLGAIENGEPWYLLIPFVAVAVFVTFSIEYLKSKGKLK